MAGKRLTPKQRVLRKWPNAYAASGYGVYAGMWVIRDILILDNCYSNYTRSAGSAWADAALKLKDDHA